MLKPDKGSSWGVALSAVQKVELTILQPVPENCTKTTELKRKKSNCITPGQLKGAAVATFCHLPLDSLLKTTLDVSFLCLQKQWAPQEAPDCYVHMYVYTHTHTVVTFQGRVLNSWHPEVILSAHS